MIKLIAIDLDDTLLDDNKKISQKNIDTIKEATKKGIKIVISSGRSEMGIKPILEQLDLLDKDTYFICYNGTRVYDIKSMEILHETYLTGKDIKKIYEVLPDNLYTHFYDYDKNLYANERNPYTDFGARINNIDYKVIDINKLNDNDKFIKLLFTGDPKNVTSFINNVPAYYKEHFSLTQSNPIYFEFLAKDTSKGHALKWLMEYLKLDEMEVAAIGDNDNDLEMIKVVGHKIVMQNGLSKKLKELATYITDTNNNDGVAKAIEYLMSK